MSHADADVATVLREDYSVLADAVNGDGAEALARRWRSCDGAAHLAAEYADAALAEYRRRFAR